VRKTGLLAFALLPWLVPSATTAEATNGGVILALPADCETLRSPGC
jgi:hypothetical protein